jgi:hypothetical protein
VSYSGARHAAGREGLCEAVLRLRLRLQAGDPESSGTNGTVMVANSAWTLVAATMEPNSAIRSG